MRGGGAWRARRCTIHLSLLHPLPETTARSALESGRRRISASAGEGAVASPPSRANSSRRRRMGWQARRGSGSDSAALLLSLSSELLQRGSDFSGELLHSLSPALWHVCFSDKICSGSRSQNKPHKPGENMGPISFSPPRTHCAYVDRLCHTPRVCTVIALRVYVAYVAMTSTW